MSNPGGVKKRMYVILTQLRMKGTITKRDWDLFKRVVEVGVDKLYSLDSEPEKLLDKINEIKIIMWGPGGCDADCNDCPVSVSPDEDDPEVCFIKAMRDVFTVNSQQLRTEKQ